MSDEDKKNFLDKNGFLFSQLPVISSKDPSLQDLKIKKDDIVHIIRKGKITYSFYRRIVE